jgi:peptide/nickel transport system ATP-binding protein/peptide/nickel transport system permease protein
MNPRLWTTGRTKRRPAEDETRSAPAAPVAQVASGSSQAAELPTPDSDALEVEDLAVTFPGRSGPVEVVKGLSFKIRRGEVVGIVGESGSGKSMTALAIARLIPYPGQIRGRVRMFGTEVEKLSRRERDRFLGTRLAFVFQDPMSSLNPALRIGTQLTQGVRRHRKLGRHAARKRAADALTEVHIPAAEQQLSRFPHEFSGGMRQRAMIAMGLIKDPTLLIADEPTTALDVTIQAQVMELLAEVNERHETAVVLISHNLALVSQNCDRVLVMYAGRIVEELGAKQLQNDALHPYTRALIATVPDLSRLDTAELVPIPGEVPDISALPPGCAFHPRCPLKIDRCATDVPALLHRPGERRVACHVANEDLEATPIGSRRSTGSSQPDPLGTSTVGGEAEAV